jgi:hypothetical protein
LAPRSAVTEERMWVTELLKYAPTVYLAVVSTVGEVSVMSSVNPRVFSE